MKSIEPEVIRELLEKVYDQEVSPEDALQALEPFMNLEEEDDDE